MEEKMQKALDLYEAINLAEANFIHYMADMVSEEGSPLQDDSLEQEDGICVYVTDKYGFNSQAIADKVRQKDGVFEFHIKEIDERETDEWLHHTWFADSLIDMLAYAIKTE